MANFNFNIKKTTYENSVRRAQTLLSENDVSNGLLYVDKAISVVKELIEHCIIDELKFSYSHQLKQLQQLKINLAKGDNPFYKKIKTPVGNASNDNHQKEVDENHDHYFSKESPSVTLSDIAGLDDVKEQIKLRVLAPLNNAEIYYKYADEAGCQILLYGPPGCGKTFIATAIAGELKCPYAIVNVHDILDKYVGEAPKKIKEIFDEAKKYDKCLIFFDELDSIFASRESEDSAHTKDILTSVLTCLSGFQNNADDKSIRVVIGATNRPWILDSALLRGKRFDTHIYVGLPDAEARRFIINKEFKKHKFLIENTDITIDELVDLFDGYSGADISSILGKVKLLPLKRALEKGTNEVVTKEDVIRIMSSYRNSITKDSLEAFEAFKNGEI